MTFSASSSSPRAWITADFDFALPPECIAQTPVEPRDAAKLLHVTAEDFTGHVVRDLPELLRAGDLLVLNNTKVIPARLYGRRGATSVEILLHKKQRPGIWLVFARPGKRLRVGDAIVFAQDFSAEILEKHESGEVLVKFVNPSFRTPRRGDPESHFSSAGTGHGIPGSTAPQQPRNDEVIISDEELFILLERHGEPPLPPYIRRKQGEAKADSNRYQTVYAAREGAVAAPTAGLHFTPKLFARLKAKGIEHVAVTLHVGAGTFLPVKAERVKDHVMHAEWGEIDAVVAEAINTARRQGRRIVAVGTTSLRLLESAADEDGIIRPFRGETDIFITPGYRFRAVDALLTNFHLPKSTLFMLVCAFAGVERMKAAYARAVAGGYRFYSYGDATLLERLK